ncbi:MAG TPA: NYN domain-containing protein [Streptosporangiaceae bacterium]|nr:NYN domain-containing protein [Streptosporangiaceae bacterium]
MRCREGLPPQEKGIDVALAVDLVHLAYRRQYNALVVFSSDTDLLPALELVVSLRLGHVGVACWSGAKPLRFAGTNRPWCHFLGQNDWEAVIEDWDNRSKPAS